MTTHELRIEGMSCGHCVSAVRRAIEAVLGVTKADVEVGKAVVEGDERVTRDALARAIDEEGYTVVG